MPQSPDIEENSDGAIFNFQISGESFINDNYHNSKYSHDIDIKLEPVTKCDKRKTAALQKFDVDVELTNCDLIVFLTNFQPSGSWIPDAWSINLTFSLIVTFYLTSTENKTKKSLTQLL